MLQTLLTGSGRKLSPGQLTYSSQQLAVEPSALYVRLALRIVGELGNMEGKKEGRMEVGKKEGRKMKGLSH